MWGRDSADLPPVTPLPVESVRVAPFTPTPTLSPTAAVLAAAEATPLPAGTTIRFAGWGTATELDALRQALAAFEQAQPRSISTCGWTTLWRATACGPALSTALTRTWFAWRPTMCSI